MSLAALRDTEVIELLSQVIEHLVSGEILQACCAHTSPVQVAKQCIVWLACLCTRDGGGTSQNLSILKSRQYTRIALDVLRVS